MKTTLLVLHPAVWPCSARAGDGPTGRVGRRAPSGSTASGRARVNITNCLPGNVPGPVVFASFDATNVFAADGTFLDTNTTNPATQSAHFGYWRHVRGNKYEFAQKFFLFDAAGVTTGWRIVRHEVVLGGRGSSFTSAGHRRDVQSATACC